MDWHDHLLYGLAWAAFGLGHSLLAGDWAKRRLGLGPWTRIAYNGFAVVHLVLVLAVGRLLIEPAPLGAPAWLGAVQWVMIAAGLAVFAWGLSGYDLSRFAGTAQIRARRRGETVEEDEPLRIDGAHRCMRHPLYAGGLLALWGVVDDALGLSTALWATFYLLIGMTLEERRLVARYGDAYRRYRERVPALAPWRGRAI